MKRLLLFLVGAMLLALGSAAHAQTITIDSISGTQFCAGDPISATFTVTGSWGQNNAFTLQLSDTGGSFDGTFTNLGSIAGTAAGTFTVVSTIPLMASYSDHYRVRIIGAYPYNVSSDNGSNLLIGEFPLRYEFADRFGTPVGALAIDIPHGFKMVDAESIGDQAYGEADTVFIDYGEGSSTKTRSLTYSNGGIQDIQEAFSVSYSTGGLKTLISRTVTKGECAASDTFQEFVFDCTPPAIPNDAIIVGDLTSGDTSEGGAVPYKTYWVNPGVSFVASDHDTIFAESGSKITGSNSQFANIVYLKTGASSDKDIDGAVIYAPGASVDKSDSSGAPALECADLKFNYSVAPSNSVLHINDNEGVVLTNLSSAPFEISPNPTSGIVTLTGLPLNVDVTAMNVLGETVEEQKASGNVTLDLSKLTRGTYYIRIASGNSVVTKKVVKE